MALQVRLVQKAGVVSLSSAVTIAMHEGWQPYGSPFVTAAAAAQVMFLPDDAAPAPDAEYFLASKDGVITLNSIILARLEDGWNMFGEPLETQYGPTQAMTKGEFKVFMPNLGFGDGQPGSGPGGLTEAEVKALIDKAISEIEQPDWSGDFTRIEQNIEEIYNVLNSLPDPAPAIATAKQEAIDAGKADLKEASDKIDKKFETQSTQIDQVWGYADQKYSEAVSFTRGEIAGVMGAVEAESAARELAITQTLEFAGAHADDGDVNTLKAANAYTDSKTAETLEASNTTMLETIEAAVLGAKDRWEAGDIELLHRTQVASRRGSLVNLLTVPDATVSMSANDAGSSRTVFPLPAAKDVPDGFSQQILNITGVADSSEWAASLRVHCTAEDYEQGFKMHTSKSEISNSFVLMPGGFATVVLDKEKKVWYYLGVNTVANASAAPSAGRVPDDDLPE